MGGAADHIQRNRPDTGTRIIHVLPHLCKSNIAILSMCLYTYAYYLFQNVCVCI